MKTIPSLHLQALSLANTYQKCESNLLEVLIEIEKEKIHLKMGYPSLFSYCLEALKLSESQAYAFMTIVRKSKEVPELKEEIKSGNLSISKARRIVPVLTKENHTDWIEKAMILPKSELEKEVSKISPYAFKSKEQVRSISDEKVSVKLELKDATWKKLKRAQILLQNKRRKNLDLEESLNDLLDAFLKKNDPLVERKEKDNDCEEMKEKGKENQTVIETEKEKGILKVPFSFSSDDAKGPGPGQVRVLKRRIPTKIRRSVLQNSKGKCTYKGLDGRTCGSANFIEVHHLRPWAYGGSHRFENLQPLCFQHHKLKHEAL